MTDLSRLARKITWILFANQSLASAGFIAAATINSIIEQNLAVALRSPGCLRRFIFWARHLPLLPGAISWIGLADGTEWFPGW